MHRYHTSSYILLRHVVFVPPAVQLLFLHALKSHVGCAMRGYAIVCHVACGMPRVRCPV